MLRRLCFALFFALVLAPVAWAGAPVSMTFDGIARTYILDGTPGGAVKPLILFLHGLGGTAQGAEQGSHLGMIADRAGFLVVFPQGLANQWNHYPNGQPTPAAMQRAQSAGTLVPDDAGFLKAIIAALVQQGVADPRRIYIGGVSEGSFMALRMLCDDAGQFAAMALIADGMPIPMGADCHPARPMPVLIEKGTADDHVPYNGGQILDREFSVWSADQLNSFFVALDGCDKTPTITPLPNGGRFRIDHVVWAQCSAGPVDFLRINGGPHTLFQFPPPAPTLWTFFKAHSLS